MAVTIRPAERRDLEALGRMGATLMRIHYAFDRQRFLPPGSGTAGGYASFLGSMIDDADARVLVAVDGESVVGYVYAALEPLSWKELRGPAGFIHDILVEEPARQAGVATALLNAALQWLRDRGAPRVVLWTAAQNAAAQALFARFGFRHTMSELTLEL